MSKHKTIRKAKGFVVIAWFILYCLGMFLYVYTFPCNLLTFGLSIVLMFAWIYVLVVLLEHLNKLQ